MQSFSSDTLSSSTHPASNHVGLPAPRPLFGRARPWLTASDSFNPFFIASFPEPDRPRIDLARHNVSMQLPYSDFKAYPSPPSSSSPLKPTVPLPVETDGLASLYSTHLAGVLDSPPVMRREDLASQKPLTPPPTMPHSTLNLPDADVDDEEVEEIEEEYNPDEFCPPPSGSSPHTAQHDLSLSPLSPSWGPPGSQALSIASSHYSPESEPSNTLFSPCGVSAPHAVDYRHPLPISPHQTSSLLGVDGDTPYPLLAPIVLPWTSCQRFDSAELPPSPTSSSPPSLNDYDPLLPPSSPLISRLDLPDLEDDGLPKIVPSSPSRRSCSGLPDSDVEMGDPTSDLVPALPGQQLLSLPGADTDDDLVPRIAQMRSIPFTPSQPLLFIDDPRDVPLPRSPSPEDFDLCLSPEDITDPELAKLCDLRKRSMAAERAAKRLESLTDDVDLFTRAEARKIRKRERERSKEVGALLRLKLGDAVAATSPQEQSPECDPQNHARRRGVIGNMSQLVAQMVFRRNETSRPLAKRKSANGVREYARSTLSDGITAPESE